mmetsp:Transcript_46069/g.89991  ORF Transcript_46069/g.89991 Transcript_46069/m.89991 type:complete len:90 (+) Transcript_46069:128-397(+)
MLHDLSHCQRPSPQTTNIARYNQPKRAQNVEGIALKTRGVNMRDGGTVGAGTQTKPRGGKRAESGRNDGGHSGHPEGRRIRAGWKANLW